MLSYAAVLFAFQLYCDFSGYVDIARGTAQLFGFQLSLNFRIFYLSRSITQFWQRWHITLTKWFTDYVYIPFVKLFKTRSQWAKNLGLLFTMGLVGLWHGANWTFIGFGLYSGLVMILERMRWGGTSRTLLNLLQKPPLVVTGIYVLFHFAVASILFRSEHIDQALSIYESIGTLKTDQAINTVIGWNKLSFFFIFLLAEMATRKKVHPLENLERHLPRLLRWVLYFTIVFCIIRYVETNEAFIYFHGRHAPVFSPDR